jgi:BON domain
MNRNLLKLMAWSGVVLLSAVIAVAQDAAPADPAAQNVAQPQGPRTDGQIEMDVVHALDASPALKNDLITAATIQSEVTLSGTVSSDASKQLAESIASHVDGVTKVHNNLKVGNPGADAQNLPPADAGAQEMPDNAQPEATPGLPPPGPGAEQGATGDQQTQPAPSIAQNPPNQYPQQQQGYPQQQQGYPQQQPYPPQGGYYPPPPPPRPQYGNPQYANPQYAPGPSYRPASGPVTIPQGTLMYLRTSEGIESKHAKEGEPVQFTVIQDVAVGGVLAIPRGATVHGVVTESKNVGSGQLGGSSELALKLVSLDLGGRSYPLDSDQFKVKSPNKAGQTVGNAVGGALIGTIIGCAVGRGAGCAIGAGAGAAGGTAVGAAEPGPRAWIPAEALVKFHLATPLTVDPVDPQEAARLAEGLYPGGPSLYRRGPYGSPYYGYAAYPYGYPAVYYRPYYMAGGYYYWR